MFLVPIFRTDKTVLHQGNENTVSPYKTKLVHNKNVLDEGSIEGMGLIGRTSMLNDNGGVFTVAEVSRDSTSQPK